MTTYTGKKSTRQLGIHTVYLDTVNKFDFRLCGVCGVAWGMMEEFTAARVQDGDWFYCPNGHKWHFSGESKEVRLERELEWAKDDLARVRARADQAQASLTATKGVVTKQKKKLARVANGVCPCCNRSFSNLARHMAGQHPDFK